MDGARADVSSTTSGAVIRHARSARVYAQGTPPPHPATPLLSLDHERSEAVRTLPGGCAGAEQNHTIANTFLATVSSKTGPPEMLKVTILELFTRFHGHAAAGKSIFRFFQSTFDLGALLRQWQAV